MTANLKRNKKVYRYKVASGIPTSLVDAAPYAAKLRRAVDLGWTIHGLENLVDVTDHAMHGVMVGTVVQIERRTAAAIASLPDTYAVPAAMPDDAFVPAMGATRRVRALLALGWTRGDVQTAVTKRAPGVNVAHIASGTHPRIKAAKWRAVAAVYEQMQMSVGPSNIGRIRAAKAGHVPPLAWECIDDPNETPTAWHYKPSSRVDQVRDYIDRGDGLTAICRQLRVSRDSFEKWMDRNSMRPEFNKLAAAERVETRQGKWAS